MLLLPNVREIWDSYEEKYPEPASRFNMKTFVVGERLQFYLPLPLSVKTKDPDDIQVWLGDGSPESRATLMGWSVILERERAQLHARVVRAVVLQVNAAVQRGDIAAHQRDPAKMKF